MDWPFIFSPLQSWSAKPFSGLASLSSLASLEASMSSHGPPPGIVGSVSPTGGRYSRHGTCWSSIWVHLVLGPSGCSGRHHFGSMDTSIDAIKITFGIQTKKYIKVKWPFGGAIIEMNHQYGFPSGLVDQRVGINGQHVGRSHGIGMVEGCWHRTLGPNDAIMEKQWHVTLMLLHIYYEVR